jgi:murein DD-endopeptidase MepM/ murein hydrolase activator NlpD
MADKRYILVVMDSSGARTKRITVMRSTLIRVALGTVALVILSGAVAMHAIQSVQIAQESLDIANENKALRESIATYTLEAQALRGDATQADISANIALRRAGLQTEASLLGSGPLDSVPQSSDTDEMDGDLPALAEDVRLKVDKIDLVMERLIEDLRDTRRLLQNTPALKPTSAGWYTSGFGKRIHPITGKRVMHKGLDIAGYTGMGVLAPADGIVIWLGGRGGYGKTVVLDHGYGIQTHFAHLHKYNVKLGDRVLRGEVIAEMGSTGISTGPHLHYEVRRHGRPLDPRSFILD